MRRLIDFVMSWLVVPIGLIGTGFYATFVTITGRNDPTSPIVERGLQGWANMWIRLAGIELAVEGSDLIDTTRSYVVVANHLSTYDIMVCFATIPVPIRFLAKKELFRYPLLSSAMRAVGMVEVDRAAHARAVEAINHQSDLVRSRGHSLMVYAEGTRSRDGVLKPFKKGAFAIASGSGLPILPMAIIGTREVIRPESIRIRRHLTVTVRFAEPITETKDVGVEELRDRTREIIVEMQARPVDQS